eukprot:TRINITY_DN14986_c0_g1_i1.p1 TRINITY_DN14986_c0_g1~~TRINITY_DN14986_c0_g1_i1.p1  ORF type:complete len:631 (+),score=139.41 TRINITY_DN14986_c0_g1_i1:86-1978(+)
MRPAFGLLLLISSITAFNVFFIPLDERFITRFAFLDLALVTPFSVNTPPMDIISKQKIPAPMPELDSWIGSNLPKSDAAIISLELILYGGLISSRCSNDTSAEIAARVQSLIDYAVSYPHIKFYLGTVIMRIPAYNEDVEEPWYWAYYGADLFTYSFYTDKFAHTHDPQDEAKAQAAQHQVPAEIVAEFEWRRQRNFNATMMLLAAQAASVRSARPLFDSIYITQDDNAQYGFNIREAGLLRDFVQREQLSDYVKIYPGADEVGLSMLARLTVDSVAEALQMNALKHVPNSLHEFRMLARQAAEQNRPVLNLVFRDSSARALHLIPNYEGQPMIQTLYDQIAAAGGVPNPGNLTQDSMSRMSNGVLGEGLRPNVTLLVNNFSDDPQLEAPNQPLSGRSIADYAMFTPFVCGSVQAQQHVVSFVDNRYSNGADQVLIQYMASLATQPSCATMPSSHADGLTLDRTAYAGWNTDGNTLGTAISNAVLLHYFATYGPFTSLAVEHFDQLALFRRKLAQSTLEHATTATTGVDAIALQGECRSSCANGAFNMWRIVEDNYWQALLRQELTAYIAQVNGMSVYTLADDLAFYEHYAFKVLQSRMQDIGQWFALPWKLDSVYYPWNRTFEIGGFWS